MENIILNVQPDFETPPKNENCDGMGWKDFSEEKKSRRCLGHENVVELFHNTVVWTFQKKGFVIMNYLNNTFQHITLNYLKKKMKMKKNEKNDLVLPLEVANGACKMGNVKFGFFHSRSSICWVVGKSESSFNNTWEIQNTIDFEKFLKWKYTTYFEYLKVKDIGNNEFAVVFVNDDSCTDEEDESYYGDDPNVRIEYAMVIYNYKMNKWKATKLLNFYPHNVNRLGKNRLLYSGVRYYFVNRVMSNKYEFFVWKYDTNEMIRKYSYLNCRSFASPMVPMFVLPFMDERKVNVIGIAKMRSKDCSGVGAKKWISCVVRYDLKSENQFKLKGLNDFEVPFFQYKGNSLLGFEKKEKELFLYKIDLSSESLQCKIKLKGFSSKGKWLFKILSHGRIVFWGECFSSAKVYNFSHVVPEFWNKNSTWQKKMFRKTTNGIFGDVIIVF